MTSINKILAAALMIAGLLCAAGGVYAQADFRQSGAEAAREPIRAGIRVGREAYRTRIVLDLTATPIYAVSEQQEIERIVVEVKNTVLIAPVPVGVFAGTPVRSLRSEQGADGALTLVLEMVDENFRSNAFLLKPQGTRGNRLVVDVYREARATTGTRRQEPAVQSQAAQAEAAANEQASTGGGVPLGKYTEQQVQAQVVQAEPMANAQASSGREARLGDAGEQEAQPSGLPQGDAGPLISDLSFGGYGELASAYAIADPDRWSRLRARLELEANGRFSWGGRFKVAGRADGDAAYDLEDDYYPAAVRDDQRTDFMIREAYLDVSTENWEYRLGRQHVVWGEMVGLFLADVVSARDTREFFLQEFETMRIPQWAVRAEHFSGNAHLELLWVPYPSYDEVGKPGADFFPFPLAAGTPVQEVKPSRSDPENHGLGGRLSYLAGGWDLSGFLYRSTDVAPTLYRIEDAFELRHDRIRQAGFSFSKDFLSFVLKGEAVYTSGRSFLSANPAARWGLQASDTMDYVVGVMVPVGDWRFDAQFYGRRVFDHDPAMGFDANELGMTLLVNRNFGDRFEWEVLYLAGLNREDWSLQPSISWNVTQTVRVHLGADLFGGREIGLFGQYDDSDRVFLEVRKWF